MKRIFKVLTVSFILVFALALGFAGGALNFKSIFNPAEFINETESADAYVVQGLNIGPSSVTDNSNGSYYGTNWPNTLNALTSNLDMMVGCRTLSGTRGRWHVEMSAGGNGDIKSQDSGGSKITADFIKNTEAPYLCIDQGSAGERTCLFYLNIPIGPQIRRAARNGAVTFTMTSYVGASTSCTPYLFIALGNAGTNNFSFTNVGATKGEHHNNVQVTGCPQNALKTTTDSVSISPNATPSDADFTHVKIGGIINKTGSGHSDFMLKGVTFSITARETAAPVITPTVTPAAATWAVSKNVSLSFNDAGAGLNVGTATSNGSAITLTSVAANTRTASYAINNVMTHNAQYVIAVNDNLGRAGSTTVNVGNIYKANMLITSQDTSKGTVTNDGIADKTIGSTVTMHASPGAGCFFAGWRRTRDGALLSQNLNYTYTIELGDRNGDNYTSDIGIVAEFERIDVIVSSMTYDSLQHGFGHSPAAPNIIMSYLYDGILADGSTYQSATRPTDAGTYTWTATAFFSEVVMGSRTDYFEIFQSAITIKADDKTRVYGSPEYTGTALYGDTGWENKLTYTVLDGQLHGADRMNGALLTETDGTYTPADTYEILRNTLENYNYDITFIGGSLVITQKPITITVGYGGVYIYGEEIGDDYTMPGILENDLPLLMGGVICAAYQGIGIGTYPVTHDFAFSDASENYIIEFFEYYEVVVNERDLYLTFVFSSLYTYNTQERGAVLTVSNLWLPLYLDYDAAEDLLINGLGADLLQNGTYSFLAKDAGVYPLIINGLPSEVADNYNIIASGGLDASFEIKHQLLEIDWTNNGASLTYAAANQGITLSLSGIYGGDELFFDGGTTGSLAVNEFNLSAELANGVYNFFAKAVGTYTFEITAFFGADAKNYTLGEAELYATVDIIQKEIKIENWYSGSTNTAYYDGLFVYDRMTKTVNARLTSGAAADGDFKVYASDTVTLVMQQNSYSAASPYTASATIFANDTGLNYKLVGDVALTWKISPRPVTLTWFYGADAANDQGVVVYTYDSTVKSVYAEAIGLVSGDSAAFEYQSASSKGVGSWTAEITGMNSNYELPATGITREWRIDQAVITLSFDKVTGLVYSGAAQSALTLTASGIYAGDEVIISALYGAVPTSLTDSYTYQAISAGDYTVTLQGFSGADSANYILAGATTESFNIAKKPLSYTPSVFGKEYDGNGFEVILNFVLSGIVSVDDVYGADGVYAALSNAYTFKNGDGQTVDANGVKNAGDYYLVFNDQNADNYSFAEFLVEYNVYERIISIEYASGSVKPFDGQPVNGNVSFTAAGAQSATGNQINGITFKDSSNAVYTLPAGHTLLISYSGAGADAAGYTIVPSVSVTLGGQSVDGNFRIDAGAFGYEIEKITIDFEVLTNTMPYMGMSVIMTLSELSASFSYLGAPLNAFLSGYIEGFFDLTSLIVTDAAGNPVSEAGDGYIWSVYGESTSFTNFDFNLTGGIVEIIPSELYIRFENTVLEYGNIDDINRLPYSFLDGEMNPSASYEALKSFISLSIERVDGGDAGAYGNVGAYYIRITNNMPSGRNFTLLNAAGAYLEDAHGTFELQIVPKTVDIAMSALYGAELIYGNAWVQKFDGGFSYSAAVMNTLSLFDAEIRGGNAFLAEISLTDLSGGAVYDNSNGKMNVGGYRITITDASFPEGNYTLSAGSALAYDFEVVQKQITLSIEFGTGGAVSDRLYVPNVFDASDAQAYILRADGLLVGEALGTNVISVTLGEFTAAGYRFYVGFNLAPDIDNGYAANYAYSAVYSDFVMIRADAGVNINLIKEYSSDVYAMDGAPVAKYMSTDAAELSKAFNLDALGGFIIDDLAHTDISVLEIGSYDTLYAVSAITDGLYYNIIENTVILKIIPFTLSGASVEKVYGQTSRVEFTAVYGDFELSVTETVENALNAATGGNTIVVNELMNNLIVKLGETVMTSDFRFEIGNWYVGIDSGSDNVTIGENDISILFIISKILISGSVFATSADMSYSGTAKTFNFSLNPYKTISEALPAFDIIVTDADGDTVERVVDAGAYRAALVLKSGDAYYETDNVYLDFNVAPRIITAVSAESCVYNGLRQDAVLSMTDEFNRAYKINGYTVQYMLNGSPRSPESAGVYDIYITLSDTNFDAVGGFVAGTFEIAVTNEAITKYFDAAALLFNNGDATYNAKALTPSIINLPGEYDLEFGYSLISQGNMTDVGIYSIEFTVYSPNFNNDFKVFADFQIVKAPVYIAEIERPLAEYAYTNGRTDGISTVIKAYEFFGDGAAEITEKLVSTYRDSDGRKLSADQVKDIGRYTLTFEIEHKNSYLAAPAVYEFEIVPLVVEPVLLSFSNEYVYSAQEVSMSFRIYDAGFTAYPTLTYDVRNSNGEYAAFKGVPYAVGSYRVKLGFEGLSANYTFAEAPVYEFKITQYKLNLSANNLTFAYDGNSKTQSYALGGILSGDEAARIYMIINYYKSGKEVLRCVDIGEYDVEIYISSANYFSEVVKTKLNIVESALLPMTLTDAKFEYDGKEKMLTLNVGKQPSCVTESGLKVSYTYSIGGVVYSKAIGAGVYTVTATVEHYGFKPLVITGRLEIEKANVILSCVRENGSLVIQKLDSAMYRINGGSWQKSNVFYDISESETYHVEVMLESQEVAGNYNIITVGDSYGTVAPQDSFSLGMIVGGIVLLIFALAVGSMLFKKSRG